MDAFDVLVQELDKELVQKRDWVASGQAKDFADYQRMAIGFFVLFQKWKKNLTMD